MPREKYMTPRERVILALEHRAPDIAPYQLDMTGAVYKKLADYYGREDFEFARLNNHLIREKNKNHVYHEDGSYTDIFGVTWVNSGDGGDIGAVKKVLLPEPELTGYTFPAPDAERIRAQCKRMEQEHPDRFRIFEISHTIFERAWSLRGMEDLLSDFLLEEAFVQELFEKLADYACEIIDVAAEAGGVDCVMFGDDWGGQNGLMMGRALWMKFLMPPMKRLFERAKKRGFYTCLHSCGDIWEIFGELIGMGLDMYNTFQPEVYDAARFKREYGAFLTVYGGIGAQSVLPRGTPEDVKKAVEELIAVLGKDGGLVVAPTHQITPDVPLENILAFEDAAQNQQYGRFEMG